MKRASEKAARTLLRDFGEIENLQTSSKGPDQFAHAAYRKAAEILRAELERARPGMSVEIPPLPRTPDKRQRQTAFAEDPAFHVAPISGMDNFERAIPHWAIAIAYTENARPHSVLVYAPLTDESFIAETGGGAFSRIRLRVSSQNRMEAALAAFTPGNPKDEGKNTYLPRLLKAGARPRIASAPALDVAYLASGRYDTLTCIPENHAELATALLLIKEAGGYLTFENEQGSAAPNFMMYAANPSLHSELVQLMSA